MNPTRWCATVVSSASQIAQPAGSYSDGGGVVQWDVYVDSTVSPGDYTLPNIYWTRALLYGTNGTTYAPPTMCGMTVHVNAPPYLYAHAADAHRFRYGQSHECDKRDVLTFQCGTLHVNCTGDEIPSATV